MRPDTHTKLYEDLYRRPSGLKSCLRYLWACNVGIIDGALYDQHVRNSINIRSGIQQLLGRIHIHTDIKVLT
jgi:hypothetical protein